MKEIDYVNNNLRVLQILVLFVFSTLMVAWSTMAEAKPRALGYSRMTLGEIINQEDRFSSFATLVAGTKYEDWLNSYEDPVTVFVPTNQAISNLSFAVKEQIMTDPAMLETILGWHVVPGRVYSGALYDNRYVPLSSRYAARTRFNNSYEPTIGTASVVVADITAQNGVLHQIDEVLQPNKAQRAPRVTVIPTAVKPRPTAVYSEEIDEIFTAANDNRARTNVVATLEQFDSFSTLVSLLEETGLAMSMRDENFRFTVFAPTNQAFEKIPRNELVYLTTHPVVLLKTLLDHVVPVTIEDDELGKVYGAAESVGGETLDFNQTNSPLVENARVIVPNLEATNGMIHVIDRVID